MADNPLGIVVTKKLVADQVYDILEASIFDGRLQAGESLKVRDIAEMVGTSVMPVRDALRKLEDVGLVATQPHKGAVVRKFTTEELIKMYDLRMVLEKYAAAQGTPNVTPAEVERMERSYREMWDAVEHQDVARALDKDEEILATVYEAAENPFLMEMIESLWMRTRAFKVLGAREAFRNNDDTLWLPQKRLIEAARHHDVEEAVSMTNDSLHSARRRLETKIDQDEAAADPPREV